MAPLVQVEGADGVGFVDAAQGFGQQLGHRELADSRAGSGGLAQGDRIGDHDLVERRGFDPVFAVEIDETAAEIAEEAAALGLTIDQAIACASGGGLTAGIALALETLSQGTEIYTAEPEQFDDHRRSIASGRRERNATRTGSICDALLSPEPGEFTFSINRDRLKGGLAASDEEVMAAMRFAFETFKIVVEPGGAVALAAVLAGRIATHDRTIAVVDFGASSTLRPSGARR